MGILNDLTQSIPRVQDIFQFEASGAQKILKQTTPKYFVLLEYKTTGAILPDDLNGTFFSIQPPQLLWCPLTYLN